MIKLILTKIFKPVQIIFIARQKKKSMQKMMRDYLNIKGKKFCAVYNKELRYE